MAQSVLTQIVENVKKVIVDKEYEITLALTALLCRGHILIEDVPGVGKTSLASALAKSMNCTFRRIQFTPDIMPSDVTGFSVLNPQTGELQFKQGAIFANCILADEINRTPPKTQSALLEAMEERQITSDGVTRPLPEPFLVMATQNPLDFLGTYPLPEAQMDRFFMRITLGYPGREEEIGLMERMNEQSPLDTLEPVLSAEGVLKLQSLIPKIHVDERIKAYIVDLVRHTRENPDVALGCSPRATLCLYRASQAWALLHERNFITPDDVIAMCPHILAHRIVMNPDRRRREISGRDAVADALTAIRVPVLA